MYNDRRSPEHPVEKHWSFLQPFERHYWVRQTALSDFHAIYHAKYLAFANTLKKVVAIATGDEEKTWAEMQMILEKHKPSKFPPEI